MKDTFRGTIPLMIGCLILFVAIPILGMSFRYIMHILTIALIYSIAATGWNVCYGYAGLLSYGHTTFFGLSAYLTVLLLKFYGLTPWIGIFLSASFASLVGMGIAWLTIRTRGIYFAFVTAAFPQILYVLFTWRYELTGGSLGLTVPYYGENSLYMQWGTPLYYYIVAASFLIMCLLALRRLLNMKFGFYLKAIGADEEAAKSIGVNPLTVRVLGMGLSSFITGLAGGIYVNFLHFIDPTEAFGWVTNLQFILSAILGGVGTIAGPVIGSFILVPLSESVKLLLEQRFLGVHLIIYGSLLMLIIVFMPKGVYAMVRKALSGEKSHGATRST